MICYSSHRRLIRTASLALLPSDLVGEHLTETPPHVWNPSSKGFWGLWCSASQRQYRKTTKGAGNGIECQSGVPRAAAMEVTRHLGSHRHIHMHWTQLSFSEGWGHVTEHKWMSEIFRKFNKCFSVIRAQGEVGRKRHQDSCLFHHIRSYYLEIKERLYIKCQYQG